MRTLRQTLAHWIPFAFAVFLCYSTLWRLAASEAKWWEPAFYAFLPMCFFIVGVITSNMEREIRELRGALARLQPNGTAGNVAA
jgi:hypothetical protein